MSELRLRSPRRGFGVSSVVQIIGAYVDSDWLIQFRLWYVPRLGAPDLRQGSSPSNPSNTDFSKFCPSMTC
jgi:hypothetical protein